MPGTRFPQYPHNVQSTRNDGSQTVSTQQQPPGTNMELLDIDDDVLIVSHAVESPVTSRYPQRANRHPPADLTILFHTDLEYRMYFHKEGNDVTDYLR